jgi:DNA-binding transcriptional MocR family regulator
MSKRTRKSAIGPYVALPKRIMATPAWRAMSPYGRLLWLELRGWLRNDHLNNGKQHGSCRKMAETTGFNRNTVSRAYAENEHFGFLHKTSEGFLGSDGYGIAAKYRFTDLAHGTHPPTRDFEKWDGKLFTYTPRRPARKKQKPVPLDRTPRPVRQDIGKSPEHGSVCPVRQDIGKSPECPIKQDISRLPSPLRKKKQGSLTARAPAQAGGAGSSPAPVASLTEYVLSIVRDQLDELDRRRVVTYKPRTRNI